MYVCVIILKTTTGIHTKKKTKKRGEGGRMYIVCKSIEYKNESENREIEEKSEPGL